MIDRGVSEVLHFSIGSILNWMGDKQRSRFDPERLPLSGSSLYENLRGNKDPNNAASFKISDVVHTARRATASISERFDNRLTLHRNLLAQVNGRRFCIRRFAIALGGDAALVEP